MYSLPLAILALTTSIADSRGPCDCALASILRARPAPVNAVEKRAVLATLPRDGEITQLTVSQTQKLAELRSVLRFHERDGVYEIKVIDVPQAWIGLYGRVVLLISRPALDLAEIEELKALAAHEIGHEYLWQQYEMAKKLKDRVRLRELELACDAIAVLTLQRIGVKPDHLVTGLEKEYKFNRQRLGRPLNECDYPSLRSRRELVGAILNVSRRPSACQFLSRFLVYLSADCRSLAMKN